MSGNFNDGPLSLIGAEIQRHNAPPPHQKAASRSAYGSLLLVGCGYTAFSLGPAALHQYPPTALYGFAAVSALGALLFVNGLRAPRIPVEFMTRFWNLFWAVAFAAGSWWLAVNRPGVWEIFWVRCFCLTFTISQSIEFLLTLRAVGGDARGQVAQNIRENEFDWN